VCKGDVELLCRYTATWVAPQIIHKFVPVIANTSTILMSESIKMVMSQSYRILSIGSQFVVCQFNFKLGFLKMRQFCFRFR